MIHLRKDMSLTDPILICRWKLRLAVGSLIWSDSTWYGIIVYTGICGKRDDLHWMCSRPFTPIHNFGQNTLYCYGSCYINC